MEEFLNKFKESAKVFVKDFCDDIPGNAAWVFLLVLAVWNFNQADNFIKEAPSVMQEIVAMEVALKGAIYFCGAFVVYYWRGIYKELKSKNGVKEKSTKK